MNDFFKNDFFKAFQDAAQQMQKNNPFQNADAFKGFTAPEFQPVDMNKLFTLQRKNIEAFTAAQKALTEGAQAIARRGAEFARDTMEDVLSAGREMASNTSAPEKAAAKQTEFAKTLVKNTAEQLREVSEMASKTQFEAFDILTSRFSRSMEEVKDAATPKATKKAA